MAVHQILSASAGTGKTYTLSVKFIQCLIRMLQSGEADDCFRKILVITFTKKATAEIRSRIFKHLSDLSEHRRSSGIYGSLGEELSDEMLDKLSAIYRLMCANRHKIKVKTIDGFINGIFTTLVARYENVQAVKVVNNEHDDAVYFEVLDRLWQHDDIRKAFAEIYLNNQDKIAEAKTADRCAAIIKKITSSQDILLLVSQNEMLQPDKAKAEACLQRSLELIHAYITESCKILAAKNKVPSADLLGGDFSSIIKEDIPPNLEAFAVLLQNTFADEKSIRRSADILIKSGISKLFNGNKVGKGNKEYAAYKQQLDADLRTVLLTYLYHTELCENNRLYQSMYGKIINIYNEVIYDRREFSHDDVLLAVYRTLVNPKYNLCQNGVVTDIFKQIMSADYSYMMIDEFQDTSVMQWATLLPMIKSLDGGFVIVGDEKQAIYGWRGGEKDLLRTVSNIFNVTPDILNTSYRSYHSVIKNVNRIFADCNFRPGSYFAAINDKLAPQRWQCPAVICRNDGAAQKGFFGVYFDRYSTKNRPKQMCLDTFIDTVVFPRLSEMMPAQYGRTVILARKNSVLEQIAAALHDKHIPTYIESSSSLFSQNVVLGIMSLLRFVAYRDDYFFFDFMRSSVIRADSAHLQRLLRIYKTKRQLDFADEQLCRDYPYFPFVRRLLDTYHDFTSIYALLTTVYEELGIAGVCRGDAEAKAAHQLLDIALQFDTSLVDYTKSLVGFLNYARDNFQDIKPDGAEIRNAVQLMTIHKSKGLEFDNVFVYNQIDRPPVQSEPLQNVFGYSDDYSSIEDFIIMKSQHFSQISACLDLPLSPEVQKIADKMIAKTQNDFVGELNNLYVALTRAAVNLVVYNVMESKDAYDKMQLSDKPVPDKKDIVTALYDNYLRDCKPTETIIDVAQSDFPVYAFCEGSWDTVSDSPHDDAQNAHQAAFHDDAAAKTLNHRVWQTAVEANRQSRKSAEEFAADLQNAKSSYAERKRLFGIAVHDYMSKITYASPEEKRLAAQCLHTKYGNIFDKKTIAEIVRVTDDFIRKCAYLFDRSKWDRVYTELLLSDDDGVLCRLDRLMFDSRAKEIKIVDYKTGGKDEFQLARYEHLVKNLLGPQYSDWRMLKPEDFFINRDGIVTNQ